MIFSDEVIIPSASFFESEICHRIVTGLSDSFEQGYISLIGSGTSIYDYIDDKLSQYSPSSHQGTVYRQQQNKPGIYPPFLSRKYSATSDISDGWLLQLNNKLPNKLLGNSSLTLPNNIETEWQKIPERLNNQAFIVPNVEPLLLKDNKNPILTRRLHSIINEQYFNSFTRELCSGVVTDLNYLAPPIIFRHMEMIFHIDLF